MDLRLGADEWLQRLPPEALEGADLVYGDAQVGGQRLFRPGWSPEYLLSDGYVGGAFVVRAATARAHGLSRATPALEWLLRPRWDPSRVRRVPEVLTRSAIVTSDSGDDDVVREHLNRLSIAGNVTRDGKGRRVHLRPAASTRVSVVVPFKDKVELLEGLWSSLLKHEAGVQWELILASNRSTEARTFDFLRGLRDPRVQFFEWNFPFNYSAINNAAARRATGDLLLFLNNDVEVRHDGWLAALAGYAQHPEIGAVGARLLYPDGSIQHAGVVIGLGGLADHAFAHWRPEYGPNPFGHPEVTRNWSAVTGACLMLRRALFEELGGFDESMVVSGSDVDLCLRAGRRGFRAACVGHVELSHFESTSRGRGPVSQSDLRKEVGAFLSLLIGGDPFYHPLLSTISRTGHPTEVEEPGAHGLAVIAPRLDR